MCCSIVILLIYKVLLYVMFEGFKVVGVVSCGSVRQNNSVVRCSSVSVVIHKVINDLWIG